MRFLSLTYNPFAENTLVIIGKENSCIIVDPGMSDRTENDHFFHSLGEAGANPTRLLLTHCHIDHVLGVKAVYDRYGLKPECHEDGMALWHATPQIAQMYGITYVPGPDPEQFLESKGSITLDGESIELRFVPGHAPGHLVLVDHAGKQVIGGDTLFRDSIGRTDLPGGDHSLLLQKIEAELFSLEDDYVVWPGHGPTTTIGYEKQNNPFLKS